MPTYADLVLPLPLDSLFTYHVPSGMDVHVGSRVVVHFGKKKYYTGIAVRIYESDEKANIKDVTSVLDAQPIVLSTQLRFWDWIAFYYICTLGDVYKAALPSSLKLESKTSVLLNPNFEADRSLTPNEQKVFMQLSPTKAQTIVEIEKATKLANAIPAIKSLVDKQAAFLSEDVKNTYVAKTQRCVRLKSQFTELELSALLDSLGKAKKQQQLLLLFLSTSEKQKYILQSDLLQQANASSAILNELVKKNIVEIFEQEVSRFDYGEINLDAAYPLNIYQQKAFDDINECFRTKDTTLLFGVTSSGKTEVYIHLIKDAIGKGKQVLYLLPEIALTTQITERLKNVFGEKIAVYHSRFNENERVDIWNDLLRNEKVQVVLGARSSIFLPFSNLGLIIVDEEHESSYKQQDPAPRYNARDAAMVLGNIHQAKVLLGTATPAIETYHNAIQGKYGLVKLSQRYEDIELPHILVVNTKELRRTKQMKSILSPPLIEQIRLALDNKEQIILFQNRRGFAPILECKTCSWVQHCEHCDVSLTYHKQQRIMICHYCGATYSIPTECPDCRTPTLDILGYGTERIEEEMQTVFADANTARMDLDTTRGKKSYEQIISNFEGGKTNVLIGTQMVSKGLDFENVSVVGVINADNLLNYPDFRAHEKGFQLMTQVSGRAGRKKKQGLVLLQTSQPGHPIISYVKNNDYESFFQLQVNERKLFHYPPFFRLIEITLRSKDENSVESASRYMGQLLLQSFANRVLGPIKPPIGRVQSLYIRKIVLKIESNTSIRQVRNVLKHHQMAVNANSAFNSVLIHYDVDPL